ncbi:unnamed protein product [Hermetia illucens]|uniref:Malate dehydrogenase, mitochondrial n=1 Tax=Hermetia illucens TaxID=343691 RepID=A0A7R8Z4M0_HERIL|nr:unnamed protein product [Hermetia illucens]
MFSQISRQVAVQVARNFSTSSTNNFKVAVCGASGGIGQPLSLLLKVNPLVTDLALYDIVHTPGVAADLSHIDTASGVKGYVGAEQVAACLKGADLVVIPAGVPPLKALNGEKNVVECAYVESKVTEAAYFSTPLLLGKNGIEENLGLPKLNDFEKKLLDTALPELKKNINKGIEFAKK